ncbi:MULTISPECIES: RidA family protein [Pseudomonas]|uniref:RidA family protein n=1 Tax=Pseudomonas TaxID=286 RepID=UPI0039061E5D
MTDLPTPVAVPNALPPQGHYSLAIRHGGLVHVSGQLPVRPDGSHTADLSFEDQVRQAMANLLNVLAHAGLGPQHLVKVTAYIVGVANWPALNAIYGEIMGAARPARSVVPVPELHYGYLVEIDAMAAAPGAGEHS